MQQLVVLLKLGQNLMGMKSVLKILNRHKQEYNFLRNTDLIVVEQSKVFPDVPAKYQGIASKETTPDINDHKEMEVRDDEAQLCRSSEENAAV